MSDNSSIEIPKPDARDKLHKLVTSVVSPIPYASEIISAIVKPPLESRVNEFWQMVLDSLLKLQEQYEDFDIDNLPHNDKFVTAMLQITRIAVENHQQEKRETLRNAVLNSALPTAPDDDRQQIFLRLLDELTVVHVKILQLFQIEVNAIAQLSLNLDSDSWRRNSQLSDLGVLVERMYPEMYGQFGLSVQIIQDLHARGLISNTFFSSPARLIRKTQSPMLTPLAEEFLRFITSPLAVTDHN